MKIDKLIVSVDNSHYKDYWPLIAKVAKKVLKVTPILIKVGDEDSDFFFDGNGLVKNVKAIDGVETRIQTLLYRLYAAKWFPEDVCLISDIDMMVLSEEYFSEQIKGIPDDDFVVYTADAYKKETFGFPVFGLCYNAAKGKVFNDILEFGNSFEEFYNRVKETSGAEWFSDEIYLTTKINEKSDQYNIHKFERGIYENYFCPTRIEKWNFPIPYKDQQMLENNLREGTYDLEKLKNGEYYDCQCARPYGWYKKEIHDVADVVLSKHKNIRTIENWDYTTINDRCFVDDSPIVDIGCLGWDWSNIFIGKKRLIGVDPFENAVPHTEMFKGIIGTYNGTTTMNNEGIATNVFNNGGGEVVEVKTWKTFCKEYNIDKISILKINIEGAEYELLNSFDREDFENIDQIAISFHDWMVPEWREKTENSLELLRKNHFEIVKINNEWGWYLATKKRRDYSEKSMSKKDLILVTAYCNTTDKLEVLRNLVKQINKHNHKFDLMLISHTTVPQDISELTDFTIYDKKNELLYDWDLRSKPWFSPEGNRPILSINTGFFNTHLAIWRMIILGNSIAKNCGYEKIHHIEYDSDIKDFKEIYDNSVLLDDYDAITYNKSELNVDDILFGTYFCYRTDTLHDELCVLDEDSIKRNIKISDTKSPEGMLFNLLNDGKKGLVKSKRLLDENGNVFGLSHYDLNFEHTAWCLPYYDRKSQKLSFIVWNMEGKRTLNVTVIYNDEKIFKFENVTPGQWTLMDIDNFENAKKLTVILNDKIRNIFDFTKDPEAFKQSSYR